MNSPKLTSPSSWLCLVDALAQKAARLAGNMLKASLENDVEIELTSKSSDIDVVTQLDKKSENLIIEILSSGFPEFGILAEESGVSQGFSNCSYIWNIDPLDGTTSFAHGHIYFCVSIALIKCQGSEKYPIEAKKGTPVYGCVYAPYLDEMFTATRGFGAFKNGKRINTTKISKLNKALVSSGFPYNRKTSDNNNLDYFSAIFREIQGFRRCGAAALDLAFIAAGRLDGYWEIVLSAWDVAAGYVLVTEAGGSIGLVEGGDIPPLDVPRKLSCVAGNPSIFKQIVTIMKSVQSNS